MKKINDFKEYLKEYKESIYDPESFWNNKSKSFVWYKDHDQVLSWDFDNYNVKWFQGAKLNITENCLDRHLRLKGTKPAIIWEPNDSKDEAQVISYNELFSQVCKLSNVLLANNVKKGDRVCLYMPMIPELVFFVLACARIGAVHSVVFAGFSSKSLSERIKDSGCKILITADYSYRGDKVINLKKIVDEALESADIVERVIIVKKGQKDIKINKKRDVLLNEEIKKVDNIRPAEVMDAEDPLFILYTSGSTGKPKGILHTTAGYMVYAQYSFINVFQYEKNDIFWCTADVGWITGHTYLIYGPLLAGSTIMMFEGVPTWPSPSRFWEIIDKHKVNIFYTAPTAIRALQAKGESFVEGYILDSLKVLGSVGEPINIEAWEWYYKYIGKSKCPIVDTWWQTETGGIMISPLAGITELKPTYATLPLPGIKPVIVNEQGQEIVENNVEGYLCIDFPWPSMLRTIYGDHERCQETYFSAFKKKYFTGDACKRDSKGYYRIIGRVDDVINVSGHRLGTAEIENAINLHDEVVESAVIGFNHEIKGQGIYAFIILKNEKTEINKNQILNIVKQEIGSIAKPDYIQFVKDLPKTRSGKIMRRILRKIADGENNNFGDTSTLLDSTIIKDIIKNRLK